MSPTTRIMQDLPRVLGRRESARAGGPLLLVTAGVHGNEPAGVLALQRVLRTCDERHVRLQGGFAAFVANKAGLARNVRYLDHDLNRLWSPSAVAALRAGDPAFDHAEQKEQRELLDELESELKVARPSVTFLDLHSTSGHGPPFTVIAGPTESRHVAANLGVPLLSGLDGVISGTAIEWIGAHGHRSLVLEGGQNEAPETIDHHESAVWLTLVEAGVVLEEDAPDLAFHRARLAEAAHGLPPEVEVGYCHRIPPGEAFEMVPGYCNFDPVVEGQLLAQAGPDLAREVRAPWTGTLIMPRYQGQGLDGFFLGRRVRAG